MVKNKTMKYNNTRNEGWIPSINILTHKSVRFEMHFFALKKMFVHLLSETFVRVLPLN